MSQDFVKVLVKDDRLNVTDAISYAVEIGGQNMTCAQFNAISQSTSSITFNIQVPSEQTIIDRRVLWKSTVVLALTCQNQNNGQLPVNIAVSDALSAFPLHQLASVMTATINNNSVSLNVRDLLPSFLRLHDKRELSRYNGMTPTAPDLLSVYADGIGSNLNSLGGWSNACDNDLLPRGSFQLDGVSTTLTNGLIGAQTLPPINYTGVLYIQFTVSEPLLLSPFIWCDPVSNNQGFYGIQNMNFVFNMGDASRVWRTANTAITGVSVVSYNNTQLLFNFLTPHPSDLFPARNCVPYWEAPRYLTSPNVALAPTTISLANIPPVVSQLATSSLQLNQVPDKLIICVRQPIGSQTNQYPDAFMCIKGLSIQFNNQSGILASATTQDLYRYSVENGSNQSWEEFSGFATIADPASGIGRKIPTSGSLLILKFGKDIQLTESYYASGSLGNFNLQINFQCFNQTPYACTPEIMISTINSGIFVNERGTSSTYTGILTKADVMAAIAQEPFYQSSVKRLVGGGFLDSLKSVAGKVLPHLLKHGKEELAKSDHPVAQVANQALSALGYGSSGGGSSGGRMKLADRLMMK